MTLRGCAGRGAKRSRPLFPGRDPRARLLRPDGVLEAGSSYRCVFQMRDDEPEARVGAGPHKTSLGPRYHAGERDERSPWTVMARHGSPAGDLNARSRMGIGRGACSNRPDSGPSRVAGSQLASDAQRLERRLAPSTRPLGSMERPVGFASLGAERSAWRMVPLCGAGCPYLLGLGSQRRGL